MHLEKLSLINFKNYKQAELDLSATINCFIGHNGAGKTNLLDAVYYLSMCKSYLNPIDTQNILFAESFFVVQGVWSKQGKQDHVYCAVKKGTKKVVKKNKVAYEKLADHIGQFPVVMISPYDRNLILEGSEVRRKWMDGIIAQFNRAYLEDLIRYTKVLEQRNALLKNVSGYGFFEPESIAVWNEQLVTYGERISEVRQTFLNDFIPIFQKYHSWLTHGSEDVSLEYKSQLIEGDFHALLKETERIDLKKQYTTVGVHKDDLVFLINGLPIKKFGSQGQQKSYLIALRLAQFELLHELLGERPLLLLDDIFDKLDNDRVARLMKMVDNQEFGQVLLTDTDWARVQNVFEKNAIPFRGFEVNKNEVVAIEVNV